MYAFMCCGLLVIRNNDLPTTVNCLYADEILMYCIVFICFISAYVLISVLKSELLLKMLINFEHRQKSCRRQQITLTKMINQFIYICNSNTVYLTINLHNNKIAALVIISLVSPNCFCDLSFITILLSSASQ